jgi:hypothetical protein
MKLGSEEVGEGRRRGGREGFADAFYLAAVESETVVHQTMKI